MLALLDSLTQENRILRLTTPLGAERLVAECLRGEEALSQPYELTVTALSTDAAIPLKSLLGQPVLLELMTSASRDQMRPFHGHVTALRRLGADGGLARYELTIAPWYAFLAVGRDSRVFQDRTVFDILDAVFNGWQAPGKLAPQWRYDIADRDIYPKRSLTCQYQESNLAFAERLMREEGLFYYFEHSGDAASPGLGGHTMVIADHNGSFQPNAQATVRFTQPGAVMKEDALDRWRSALRWIAGGVELASWDYRSRDTRPVSAASVGADPGAPFTRDAPGAYAYTSREHGERIAQRQVEALEAGREIFTGAGTVRTLSAGTTFTLEGQATLDAGDEDGRNFLITRVVHLAHNNLSADIRDAAAKALGVSALAEAIGREQGGSLHAVGAGKGERPLYRNRIDAIRSKLAYRSSDADGHGLLLHPKPTVRGQQTAIVVGPAGAVIHTDRDHRIKIQFHWQRGEQSHSRLSHPTPDGHSGAPADDAAGTWVRIATAMAPVAGANWGSVAVPRVGSEVLVDFIDGDIDRPVVIGSVYNGRGAPDAQNNQVAQGAGVTTGNAPAWFPGESGAHAHPAALSGIKSQAMNASQSGAGAYSQLVFDDHPGESRVALQRHASPHAGTAELNLGHLRHQSDNRRLQTAGFGAELKTEHSVALRGGKGVLLSTDARAGGSGAQLDSREAQAQIEQSHALQVSLAETAQKHNAKLKDEAEPGKLTALAAMENVGKVVQATSAEAGAEAGAGGNATAYSEQHLQLSSPAGMAAQTPVNAVLMAGGTSSLSADQDINFASQGNAHHLVKDGIGLFTYGKANSADKPNQETGIKLHAATGKVSVQSQTDATKITADKMVTVASITKSVTVGAKQHVMLTAQGASLKLEGGNIMIHGPGAMTFKASLKELTGPANGSVPLPAFKARDLYNEAFVVRDEKTGEIMKNVRYRMESASGAVLEGFTDAEGRTRRLFTAKPEQIHLYLPDHD